MFSAISKRFFISLEIYFQCNSRSIYSSSTRYLPLFPPKKKDDEVKPGVKTTSLVRVQEFFKDEAERTNFDAKQFINTIDDFNNLRKVKRFGYAEFILAALPMIKELGVEKDLEAYKALMRVFPKGAFIPSSKIAMGFYPHVVQQRAAMEIIELMHENRLIPDKEFENLVVGSFSEFSQVWQKCARLIYWQTKIRNANPFPFPENIPTDPLELAIVALKRMTYHIDPQTDITVYWSDQFEDSKEDTWVCFCQSDSQKKLLNDIEIEKYRVSVDGPFKVYIESNIVTYFVLYARDLSPKPNFVPLEEDLNKAHELNNVSDIPFSTGYHKSKETSLNAVPSVHAQEDGIILSIVATGTSSQESLLTYIRMLQKDNPRLKSIPVIISNKEKTENN